MKIWIKDTYHKIKFFIIVNEDDTIEDIKEKIIKTKMKEIPHSSHDFYFEFKL